MALRKLDGDVLLLKPGDAAVFRAEAGLDPARADRIGRSTGSAACSLAPRKIDMPGLFESAVAEMDLLPLSNDRPANEPRPVRDEVDPPVPRRVPRYDPQHLQWPADERLR